MGPLADRAILGILAITCFLGVLAMLVYSAGAVRSHKEMLARLARKQAAKRQAEQAERQRLEAQQADSDIEVGQAR